MNASVSRQRAARPNMPFKGLIPALLGGFLIFLTALSLILNLHDPITTMQSLQPEAVVGVILDDKLRVVEVEEGGAAQKAGLLPDDRLKRVENTELVSSEEAKQVIREKIEEPLIEAAKRGERPSSAPTVINLVIERAGQEVSVQIIPSVRSFSGSGPTATPVPAHQTYF